MAIGRLADGTVAGVFALSEPKASPSCPCGRPTGRKLLEADQLPVPGTWIARTRGRRRHGPANSRDPDIFPPDDPHLPQMMPLSWAIRFPVAGRSWIA